MRLTRAKIILLYLLVTAVQSTPGLSFHDHGVGPCNGCHTIHNSPGNPAGSPGGNPFLLLEANPSDVCLRCHDVMKGNAWGRDNLNPGEVYGAGQFVFLLEDNLNNGADGDQPAKWISGHEAGHNVISRAKGTSADPVNSTAPGGTYRSSALNCVSCHDPHGRGGHYRLLHGSDYPVSSSQGYLFTYTRPAPRAEGIRLTGAGESPDNHPAYRSGISEWCGNCHGDYHNTAYPAVLKHPSGAPIGAAIAANYNRYQGTGHFDGDGSDAYLPMVPVEDPGMTTGFRGPVSGSSKVMCLTCHRAHASPVPNAVRWDFRITTWAESGVRAGSYRLPNPYQGTAGDGQRSLCNKCHALDVKT